MLLIFFKDLILKSRIKEAASGKEIIFAKSADELSALLKNPKFTRLIIDLSSNPDLIEKIKPALHDRLESIAVISHVDIKSHKSAQEAGFRMVIPRSKFVNELNILLDCDYPLK